MRIRWITCAACVAQHMYFIGRGGEIIQRRVSRREGLVHRAGVHVLGEEERMLDDGRVGYGLIAVNLLLDATLNEHASSQRRE